MKTDEGLKEILASYDDSCYPEDFLAEYDITECLSEHNGICTFLIRDHNGLSRIAKCTDKSLHESTVSNEILTELSHEGLPRYIGTYENERMSVTVREYIEGETLNVYEAEHGISRRQAVDICIKLCDILSYLHHRKPPVIHRDIKPRNIIIRPDGGIVLIDFDIARVYNDSSETDTVFFGTREYAPPEQYGFSQTDARTDIYSLGILLRWLLTGSTKERETIRIYRPLAKIIKKCTGFAPKDRFSDAEQVKRALERANPRSQAVRIAAVSLCMAAAAALLAFGGVKLYRYVTYDPFSADAVPAYLSDEERIKDAVGYMKDKYDTDMFDDHDEVARVGDLRKAMIELYGLERDYVYGINTDMPQESDAFFLPWGWDDIQTLDKGIVIYAAVKVHDPAIVADWSGLKDDNGYYPGARVAAAFASEHRIADGINRPSDITLGDMAIILADTDRVFGSAEIE